MSGSFDISITLGRCDEMRAEAYVAPGAAVPRGARLEGVLVGPYRRRDVTLPMQARLEPLADPSGARPVSRVVLTEPAFWSPESPNLYRASVRLESPEGSPITVETSVGLRRLGVRGRSFWLDGRRWVPRAVAHAGGVDAASAAATGLMTGVPDESLLSTADDRGVAVVVLLAPSDVTITRLATIARHPSVVMAIVVGCDQPTRLADAVGAVRRVKGTLQLGIVVPGAMPGPAAAEGFDFVAVGLADDQPPHEAWRTLPSFPLVAWRRSSVVEPTSARSACDRLQRDLAAWRVAGGGPSWDWAGYLVG